MHGYAHVLFLICALSFLLLIQVCEPTITLDHEEVLLPEQVVVSLSIDSSSLEIQREAIRLLTSIHLYGESLQQAHIFICINHDVEDVSDTEEIEKRTHFLVEHINELHFDKLTIRYSKSLPYPKFAPSLNKMCAFDPDVFEIAHGKNGGGQQEASPQYLLYLDADIFVAQDPLPLLESYLPLSRGGQSVLLCGRPFSTAHNEVDFSAFSGIPDNPFLDSQSYPLISTLNGGYAYYGMCNTGIYFMELQAAQQLARLAGEYLSRASAVSPDITGSFLIDSFILWSAQQMLQFQVELFSLRLNFMVPAEDFYEDFLLEEMHQAGLSRPLDVSDTHRIARSMPIALFHFSRGSDVHFEIRGMNHNETCAVLLRSNSKIFTLTRYFFQRVLSAETTGHLDCFVFYYMLEPFVEYVTVRDDEATSYFR